MIFLLLSILSSTLILIIFKIIERFKLDNLQVIVVNYFTACAMGFFFNTTEFSVSTIVAGDWFTGAVILGILFIVIFNVMALTAQQSGLSVVSVASKMSIVIPILFGIYMYHESHNAIKIIGIVLALAAVYLASVKSEKLFASIQSLWLPMVLFAGSGFIDTYLKYLQHHHLDERSFSIFSSSIFLFAGTIGLLMILFKYINNKDVFNLKSLPFGILLGIVNFGSIYFLLKALNMDLESSTVFTINNVAIVLASSLIGLIIFKEKLYPKNWLGIGLAIISIILVSTAI